jgi:hypothetical protein
MLFIWNYTIAQTRTIDWACVTDTFLPEKTSVFWIIRFFITSDKPIYTHVHSKYLVEYFYNSIFFFY